MPSRIRKERKPGLIAAVEVGGVDQAEVLQRGGGEALGVALVADDDDRALVVAGFGQPVRAVAFRSPSCCRVAAARLDA